MPDLIHDYSALSLGADCWRKYFYRYVERLVTDGPDPPYLHAGSAGHKVMLHLYTQGWDLEAAIAVLRAEWGDFQPAGKHSYLTLGHMELCIEDYFEDRSRKPTALEAEEAVSSREGAEGAIVFDWAGRDGEVLRVGGIPDLPTVFAAQRYIVDNKFTTSWINSTWAAKFRLGHQFRVYCAALYATTGVRYDGAYINAIYIGEPPKSGWAKVKSVQNQLFGPFHYTEAQLLETWEWVRSLQETEQLYERLGMWPQNEQACAHYGGCEYLPLCERTPELRPAIIEMQYRRKEAGGQLVSGADG
jgi:hypothetical protein